MTTLVVAGLKGGVGKTTTAVNVAAELAVFGWDVLLVDLDPQASASLALGHGPALDPFTAEALEVELDLAPGLSGSLAVLPGGRRLAWATEEEVAAHLEEARAGGKLVVVDTPPTLSALTLSALEVADLVLAPMEATPLSLPSLRELADLLGSRDTPPPLRALMVRVQARRLLTSDVTELLGRDYPGVLYPVTVPEDVKAAEAPGYGLPLNRYAKSSRAGEAYTQVAGLVSRELMARAV